MLRCGYSCLTVRYYCICYLVVARIPRCCAVKSSALMALVTAVESCCTTCMYRGPYVCTSNHGNGFAYLEVCVHVRSPGRFAVDVRGPAHYSVGGHPVQLIVVKLCKTLTYAFSAPALLTTARLSSNVVLSILLLGSF